MYFVYLQLNTSNFSNMSKQHLIFMPESGPGQLKFTTELVVKPKHDNSTCSQCQDRVKEHTTLNFNSYQVQNQILVKQRQSANLWIETLKQIEEGSVWGKCLQGSCMGDVIVIDDVEEIHTPALLPVLSPIVNTPAQNFTLGNVKQLRYSTPVREATPTKLNTPVRQSPYETVSTPNQQSSRINLSTSNVTINLTEDDELDWELQSPKPSLVPLKQKISMKTIELLIYKHRDQTHDHVFWIDRADSEVQFKKKQLIQLRQKLNKARNYLNFDLAPRIQAEIESKEAIFAAKHIHKVQVTENLKTQKPLDESIRNAMYDPMKTNEMFNVRKSAQQQVALNNLYQYKCDLLALEKLKNKYAPLVANELFYKENMYWKQYLSAKKNDEVKQVPPVRIVDLDALAADRRDRKARLQQKRAGKRERRRKKLKERHDNQVKFRQTLNTSSTLNESSTSTDPSNNLNNSIISEPASISCYTPSPTTTPLDLNTTLSSTLRDTGSISESSTQNTPQSTIQNTPGYVTNRKMRLRTRNCMKDIVTPTKVRRVNTFQPYRSLLRFPSPNQ